jgi:hypothetical protein
MTFETHDQTYHKKYLSLKKTILKRKRTPLLYSLRINNTSLFQAIQYQCNTNAILDILTTRCSRVWIEFPGVIYSVYFSMFYTPTLIWNSSYSFFLSLLSKMPTWTVHAFWSDKFSVIAWVLLIFLSSIAIPIPGLQYCIAIQNSMTMTFSSLIFFKCRSILLHAVLGSRLGCYLTLYACL